MVDAPTIAPDDELLTSLQAARELGVVRTTLATWVFRGWLRARETPAGMLIRRQDLDHFKATRKIRARRTA